jgi:DNA-binding beta-propeller fold protein YncE
VKPAQGAISMRFQVAVVQLCWAVSALAAPPTPKPESIAIPGGEPGVGYDDLQYAPAGKRILVPAGRTGRLALIDPATKKVTAIAGFSAASSYHGGHGQGTTSAAELDEQGFVVATDRGSKTLKVVDTMSGSVSETVKLTGAPDYVRVASSTHEVWVTEPGRKQIEVLRIEGPAPPRLAHVANIPVPDGPESLVIDAAGGRAYSHTWSSESFAIDLKTRRVVATWRNGCRDSRGIALDQKRGLLFTGCAEGKATVVNLATERLVSSAPTGPDVDSIGYGATLGHLYVPAGGSAELWIFGVAPEGKLGLLGKVATASDAHTAAFDAASSTIFVGTPDHGAVLAIPDGYSSNLK